MKQLFSTSENIALAKGEEKRKFLQKICIKAADAVEKNSSFRHWYIFGPPGVGKTYNIMEAVKSTNVPFEVIKGNTSPYMFGIELAVAKYKYRDQKVVIIVDDCDAILGDINSINQMKEALEKDTFSYKQRMSFAEYGTEGDLVFDALTYSANPNGGGIIVDLSTFNFVFTSNVDLPKKQLVEDVVSKVKGAKSKKVKEMEALYAIRSRVMPQDCNFDEEELWGNIASVIMNPDNSKPEVQQLSLEERIFILKLMKNKQHLMNEFSIRTAEKACQMYIEEGEEFEDAFELIFLS